MKISRVELLGSLKQSCCISYAFSYKARKQFFFLCRLQSLAIENCLCQNARIHNWVHIWASQTSEIFFQIHFYFELMPKTLNCTDSKALLVGSADIWNHQ